MSCLMRLGVGSKHIIWLMCFGSVGYANTYRLSANPRPSLAVGDLVLVVDEASPRGFWPKGIVQEVFPDKHGVVRQVLVRTASSALRRDVRKLRLLEGALFERD